MKHRLLAAATMTGFVAGLILGLVGCAAMAKNTLGGSWPQIGVPKPVGTQADQQGVANVATGPITGLSYQSVLPAGVAILLGLIVVIQTGANSFEDWLLHRQQMMKLKQVERKA